MEGRCACGTIAYRLSAQPYDAGWCHCRICQRWSGAPALVFATVALADWQVIAGTEHLGSFRSTTKGVRQYCRKCGTSLTMHVAHQPEEIDFTIATLDDPELVVPGFHIFASERIGWAAISDELPRHDRLRPMTRLAAGSD